MSPSRSAKKKHAQKPQKFFGSYSMVEVDSARVDPKLRESAREKNKEALACALDPSRGKTNKSSAADTAWYVTSSTHHVTGNLDLLTDITAVSDRWIQSILGIGPVMQVLARGSVNCNGIVLHDVWLVPDCKVNVVSTSQLGLKEWLMCASEWTFIHHDDRVVGKAYPSTRTEGLYEFDYINTSSGAVWYIASNVSQHMTGNLDLLTDFNTIRPSRTIRTNTGDQLQVCGHGSVKNGQLSIPNVSYVPGLREDIISISQLTDSGYTIEFGADGFSVKNRYDGKTVGSGSYGGSQLFRLDSLMIPEGNPFAASTAPDV